MRQVSENTVWVERRGTQLVASEILENPDPEAWGQLSFVLQDGVLHLIWTGTGPFQLQISYDLETWHNEGTCREGPADIIVSPKDEGATQYYRIVPCESVEQD